VTNWFCKFTTLSKVRPKGYGLGVLRYSSSVDFQIPAKTLKLVGEFIEQTQRQHEDQWSDVSKKEADFEWLDKLGNAQQKEEHVEEILKLVVQK